jgi:hypothetical protein
VFEVRFEELSEYGEGAVDRKLFESVESAVVQVGMAQFA